MILNGKAKEEFLVWYFNSYLKEDKYCLIKDVESFFDAIKNVFQNALIIEWFDKNTDMEIPCLIWNIWSNSNNITYSEATEKAIEKANNLYNENNK